MRPDARAWFQHCTSSAPALADIDVDALLRGKRRGGHRVSVVLPARNEEAGGRPPGGAGRRPWAGEGGGGPLGADVGERWMRRVPLGDEVVVVDSDSTDATAAVARAAGAD